MAVEVHRRGGGDFTLPLWSENCSSLTGSRGILIHSKTCGVYVCEIGILSRRAWCACATITPPSRLHTAAAVSWRDNSIFVRASCDDVLRYFQTPEVWQNAFLNVLNLSSILKLICTIYIRGLQSAARGGLRSSGEFCMAREGYFTKYNALWILKLNH